MEERVTRTIVERYFAKLRQHLALDVAVVGSGPSGLVCAAELARAGKKVALFERRVVPGGGTWGGGMLFNEVVIQDPARPILERCGIRCRHAEGELWTVDAVEMAAGLIFSARQSGAVLLNGISVEDVVCQGEQIGGVVVNWGAVSELQLHVDPLVFTARAVLDATGHPSEVAHLVARKARLRLDTPSGQVMGERPMWMERAERATVEDTKRLCPGFYVCGMAANNVAGAFRMGPIFGGMLLSGEKAARLILGDLPA